MPLDTRKMWAKTVAQAWVNLEADGPSHEDTLIIKIDEHIKKLEAKLAEHYHSSEIELSRALSFQERARIVSIQIEKERSDES